MVFLVGVVAVVAIVVMVLTYLQTTAVQKAEIIYDVFDEKGNLVAYAVGDIVYPLVDDHITGVVTYEPISKFEYLTIYPKRTFVPRSVDKGDTKSIGGGAGWN